MAERYDLHCHSTASDGSLPPAAVVERASRQGVTVLALTDHDSVAGLEEASRAASACGMRLINGIELSAMYMNECVHVVGLNIDPEHAPLRRGLDEQQRLRAERAKTISDKLEKRKIFGAYQAVMQASAGGEITRSHFADFLVAGHYVSTQQEAFDRYLSKGKPGYAPTCWAGLSEATAWIVGSGGVAVLAHPLRYRLSLKWLHGMLDAFKLAGGQGVEVVTGRASDEEIRVSAQLAQKHGLYASLGSDFHTPEQPWQELGRLAELPPGLPPVWRLF